MIPTKTIEELITKHSNLEKELSSGELNKYLQKNLKNILILMKLLILQKNTLLLKMIKSLENF